MQKRQRRITIMLRREMIPMMGSIPMHMMRSSSLYFFSFSFPPLMFMYGLWLWIMEVCVDYGYLICYMCYFFPFLDDELMIEFQNFECWIIFSYVYCVDGVFGVWSMVWSMD
ncbi:hypothetical protein AMTRI_Chr02g216080 [Amborella trichopoda]